MIRKIWAIIVILIFISPILFAYCLFFYKQITFEVKTEKTSDNKLLITILKNKTGYPLYQDIIARVFQIPLNLTHYNVCFRNESYAEEAGKKEDMAIEKVELTGTNGENLGIEPFDIPANGKKCQELNLDKLIINKVNWSYQIKYLPTEIKLNPNVFANPIAYPSRLDKWITAIIFTIAFEGFLLLIRNISIIIWSKLKIAFGRKLPEN